jgi:hypothetical protein
MKKLIETRKLNPGQQFEHYGLTYCRATEDEEARHPGRELARKTNRDLVFAYSGEGDGRQPVTFVPDLQVVVRGGKL